MTHLYFKSEGGENGGSTSKPQKGWGERLSFEQLSRMGVIQLLLEIEGLAFVAGQSDGGSHHRTEQKWGWENHL